MYVLSFQPDGPKKCDVSQHGIMSSCSALQKDRWWVSIQTPLPGSTAARVQPGSFVGSDHMQYGCKTHSYCLAGKLHG